MTNPSAISLNELCAAALRTDAFEQFSTLTGQKYLLVDVSDRSIVLSAVEFDRLRQWLQRLPCPSLALGHEHAAGIAHELGDAFDVSIASMADAATIIRNIERAPIAAMTLVQVLRSSEHVAPILALTIESLAYATLQAGAEFQHWLADNPPSAITIADAGPPLLIARASDQLQVQLNRASRRNAISVEMRDALVELFQLITADESLRRIAISGNGACFSIGGDLDEFGTAPNPASAHAIRSLRLPARYLLSCADRVAFHVHSACIGAGIEIPAFGHRITATRNAFFQLPEIRFGLIPGAGGCVSIPRRIGRQRAAYMALSAKKINAVTALEWGLIDEIVA